MSIEQKITDLANATAMSAGIELVKRQDPDLVGAVVVWIGRSGRTAVCQCAYVGAPGVRPEELLRAAQMTITDCKEEPKGPPCVGSC